MATAKYPPTFFVIGTDRNIGKTVTSMGIVSKLTSDAVGFKASEVGYIKPVGQQTSLIRTMQDENIEVDKDILLFTELYKLRCRDYRAMSPVVWEGGYSEMFIDAATRGELLEKREELCRRICEAFEVVSEGKKVVVCEGTGQPGVGSVAGVSNGDVINLLKGMGVPVFTVLVARGGIGSTIDRLFPHLLSMNCMDCQVDGMIVNAVRADKIEKVRDYLQRYYRDAFPLLYCSFTKVCSPPPILGLIPEVPELEYPSMRLLAETFFDEQIDLFRFTTASKPIESADWLVKGVKVLSLDHGFESYLEDGDLVIVGINANDAILSLLKENQRLKNEGRRGLAGLILSCSQAPGIKIETINAVANSEVPTLVLPNDSADIVRRIVELSVKIQPYDVLKRKYVDKAYQNHLDFSWVTDWIRKASGD